MNAGLLGKVLLAGALAGCAAGCGGGGGHGQPVVSFAQARQGGAGIDIAGNLEFGSLHQATGQPTRFDLRESGTADKLTVVAGPEVSVPANLVSSKEVRVTGTWDAAAKQFRATTVETRVPNRDEQLHN